MKTRILFVIALLLSVNVSAERSLVYLIKPEPDWLGYSVDVHSEYCGIRVDEVEKIVEGAFVRSRIEPAKNISIVIDADDKEENVIYLNVVLNCLDTEIGKPNIFNLKIEFSQWIDVDNGGSFIVRYGEDYGTTGSARKQFIKDTIKNRTENALTDYIKVNFIDNKK